MIDNTAGPQLMAVHAHPDEESTSTGGILARYALKGMQTIVVTCTNAELGDGPGGVKPGADGHQAQQVAATRLAELRTACQHLGVTHLELLATTTPACRLGPQAPARRLLQRRD